MITSAGDVLVTNVRCRAELPIVAFLKNPIAVVAIDDKSRWPYELITLNRSRAASLARFGSFRMPYLVIRHADDWTRVDEPEWSKRKEDPRQFRNGTNQK